MEKSTYNKYLTENITKHMKNQTETKSTKPTMTKKIAIKLKIEYKVQQFHEGEILITVKDYKDNFPNFLVFRKINPCKSEIG